VDPRAPAGAFDVGDRGDARQRLAAKSQAPDAMKVGEARDLAGRVTEERQRQLAGLDAGAVVADADRRAACAADVDGDAAGLGVEGVLDELLDG